MENVKIHMREQQSRKLNVYTAKTMTVYFFFFLFLFFLIFEWQLIGMCVCLQLLTNKQIINQRDKQTNK